MDTQSRFAQARAAIAAGRRDEGRTILVSILREAPTYVPAWLWLSGVLDDPAKRRECLERVLAIDPHNAAALHGLEVLDMQSVADSAREPTAAEAAAHQEAKVQRLGEYLVQQRMITQQQLDAALREQQQETRYGRMVPLGDILLRRRWLTLQALTRALELQKEDRVKAGVGSTERLGEYLVKQYIISERQLEEVIARQAALKRQGQSFQLGELLVLSGMISRQQLQRAIDEHQQQFMRQIDNS